jgi:hypothetical protein
MTDPNPKLKMVLDDELRAEIHEISGMTEFIDEIIEHHDLPYWTKQELENSIIRRQYPGSPYKRLNDIPRYNTEFSVEHANIDPHKILQLSSVSRRRVHPEEQF